MKSISIPAQVTTVEDRIIGNLTLMQLGLLVVPIFIDFVFYSVLPSPMKLNGYKLFLISFVTLTFFTLAIKRKEKIILLWLLTLSKFRLRRKIYVFSKKSTYLRNFPDHKESKEAIHENHIPANTIKPPFLNIGQSVLRSSNLNVNYIEERKGKLYVYVNEN